MIKFEIYEFDGTIEGYRKMMMKIFNEYSPTHATFDEKTATCYLRDGLVLQKGDHYQIRLPEKFEAIG